MQRPGFERHGADRESSLGVYGPAMERLAAWLLASRSRFERSDHRESGVGKERLARFSHDTSPRSNGPSSRQLRRVARRTFRERAVWSRARRVHRRLSDRPSVEAADKGTLSWTRWAKCRCRCRSSCARAPEHEIRRVGENRQRKVTARVTPQRTVDLAQDVKERRFRRDLFYRLNVVNSRYRRSENDQMTGRPRASIPSVSRVRCDGHHGYTRTAFELIPAIRGPATSANSKTL